jgi:hypothetical protein
MPSPSNESHWQKVGRLLANDVSSAAGTAKDIVGRGVVAPILGFPMDMFNLGARRPEHTGSSEFFGEQMQDAGIVSPDRNYKSELAASLLNPAAISAKVAAIPALAATFAGKRAKSADIFAKGGTDARKRKTTPGRILNKTNEKGGYTINLASGEVPQTGLMMGIYSNKDPRNLVTKKLTKNEINAFINKNKTALMRPNKFLGTWKDDGKTYLDVSQKFPPEDIRKATKFGERTKQISGWDNDRKKLFPVGDWDEFMGSKEFQGRMNEMAAEGRDYLSKFSAKEWWDVHGSPFERVYGKDKLEQLIGYIASTAPNSAPRQNIQTASEYMRRMIKGEPTVQPNYRIPANQMNRTEGVKIGMEEGRTKNLLKSEAGQLGDLEQNKVREEAAALMGDPNAVVLDRHWARLGENPSKGIFTATKEGVIPPKKQYETMKNAVQTAAKLAGRTPRDFSADVWTGIRERIKNTSELYGQKFQGSAITGDSKSYADVFEELIRDKAKHMGITVKEMEKRLKSGDATLLSLIAATPLLSSVFQSVLDDQPSNQI